MSAVKTEMLLTELEAAAILLLGKELTEHGKVVPAGKAQEVDVMIHIKGLLNKGEGYNSSRRSKPTAEAVCAWFLSRVTEKARSQLLDEFVAQAKTGGLPKVTDEVQALAETMISVASSMKIIPVTGRLTGSLNVSAVDFSKLKPLAIKQIGEVSRLIDFDLLPEENEEDAA